MDYVKPVDLAAAMIESGNNNLKRAPRDLLVRGALLGAATSLALGNLVGGFVFSGFALYVTHSLTLPTAMTTVAEVPAE